MSDLEAAHVLATEMRGDTGSACLRSLTQAFAAYRQRIGDSVAK